MLDKDREQEDRMRLWTDEDVLERRVSSRIQGDVGSMKLSPLTHYMNIFITTYRHPKEVYGCIE